MHGWRCKIFDLGAASAGFVKFNIILLSILSYIHIFSKHFSFLYSIKVIHLSVLPAGLLRRNCILGKCDRGGEAFSGDQMAGKLTLLIFG